MKRDKNSLDHLHMLLLQRKFNSLQHRRHNFQQLGCPRQISTFLCIFCMFLYFCAKQFTTFVDYGEEKLGDSDSNDSPKREEISIDSMQNSLQGLPLSRVRAEEQPEKFLDERLVHHCLQAVGVEMLVLEEAEENRVGKGEVCPVWILPPFILLL